MSLHISRLPAGPLATNAYVIVDEISRKALVIDAPPGSHEAIVEAIRTAGATVQALVLTHGHWDHIVDTEGLRVALDAPVVGHEKITARVESPGAGLPEAVPASQLESLLVDGDIVPLGTHRFAVLFLPGHDAGHIALYEARAGVLFSGDVLFPGGHGRTDIPGSDEVVMRRSLRRLLDLPDSVTVYTGHGEPTTIGAERAWMERLPED